MSHNNVNFRFSKGLLFLVAFLIFISKSNAQGTWTALSHLSPNYNGGVMLLLTDGTVIAKTTYGGIGGVAGNNWDKLTPDASGSYANGTWSSIAPMINDRLYFSSWVMSDGRVYVGGGEYGAGTGAEIYNPKANTWTSLTTPGAYFSDGNSENLPDGKILLGVATGTTKANYIYDPVTNTFTAGPDCINSHAESAWLKLPDNSILQVDFFATTSERYIPSSNTWIADATVPVALYDPYAFEAGTAVLLPDGRGFFLGSTGHTAFYTPSGNTSPGTWAAGPDIPGGKGTPDAPAAMLNNGKVLIAVSPTPTAGNDFPSPTSFYEFDYLTNTYTSLGAPGGGSTGSYAPYITNMLNLPDGKILFVSQGNKQYYLYTPDGTPLTASKPTVDSIIRNNCDTFTVTGKLFTGISEGSSYGDDWAMSTNFPIVKLTSGSNVYYAKAFNWNRIGTVMTGTLADTVQFELPSGLTPGSYSLQIVVNGNPSAATSFNTDISISGTSSALCLGATTTFSGASSVGIWSSSNTGVATVNASTGVVTGAGAGSANIYYTLSGCSSTKAVSVNIATSITASADTNGTISPSGITTLCPGGSQTYSITPATGYHISSVTIDGSSIGTSSSYTFSSVTAGSHAISATFDINTYTIDASSTLYGTITPSGTTTLNYGSSQTYTMNADWGFNVVDVVVDGSSVGAVTSYTFSSIAANHTISVTYDIIYDTVFATAGANGSISPAGSTPVSYGNDQFFSITPDTGYIISDVIIDGSGIGPVSAYVFFGIDGNHTISAVFAPDAYIISASAGSNGTITPYGDISLSPGATQSFTITPATGYHISDVIEDGSSMGAMTTCSFTSVSANHTVSATFDMNTYTITSSAGSNGTISPAGTSVISYGGSQTYTFTANTGYHINDVIVDGTSVGAVSSYTFSAISTNHTISVSYGIDIFSITAASGANGTITPSGVTSVSYGGSQTYTFAANTGYHINSVTIDGTAIGSPGSYTFSTVTTNHSISVSYAINTFTISASSSANGSISPSGTSTNDYGSNQTYTFTASTGYQISNVTVDGTSVGTPTTYTFSSVAANHTISVSYSISSYTITASSGSHGTISPSGTTTRTYGSSQTYTFSAASGYHINSVTVDGTSVGTPSSYTFSSIAANHTIAVTFSINSFTITASAGSHGTISPSGTVAVSAGASQTFTITPASGYHVNTVTVDGASVGAVTTYTFSSITANHTISATFAINTFTITASAGSHGSVSPSGTTTVSYGVNQTYTIAPASGYHISSVTVDGASAGTASTYTFSSVTSNHTISAAFAINTYTITSGSGSNGTISPSGTTTVSSGGSQVYTFTANTGYHISSIVVDGASMGTASSYTFSSVNANHTINVSFAINTFTITSSHGSHGNISPNGASSVTYGSNKTYTMTANSGYHISSVLVDGTSVGTSGTYTFSSVAANHTIAVSFAVNTALAVSLTPSPTAIVTGQSSYTIFENYGDQSFTLIATASGGTPGYTHSWSPSGSCSSPYSSTTLVTPTATTTYIETVTDSDGNVATDSVTIYYQNTNCNPSGDNHHHMRHHNCSHTGYDADDEDDTQLKVCICHSGHTLSVDSSSVSTHLAHGDYLGSCSDDAGDYDEDESGSGHGSKQNNIIAQGVSTIEVYPNPSEGIIFIAVPAANAQATIIITDLAGKTIETREISDNNGLPVAFDLSNVSKGIYLVRVIAGKENYTTKINIR